MEYVTVVDFMLQYSLQLQDGEDFSPFLIDRGAVSYNVYAYSYKISFCLCFNLAGGKSAILVAIVVGLGGAAASTKRGQSLKNFIKEGCR